MRHLVLLGLFLICNADAAAQSAAPQPGKVLVHGTVADEASKASVLARLRSVYGPDQVVDQITVGGVSTPANWNNDVHKLITPDLKRITRGELKIDGNSVSLKGEVESELLRQKISSDVAAQLDHTYKVSYSLRVSASARDQEILDKVLAKRSIEFESGKATLTPSGRAILDDMKAVMLLELKDRRIHLIGHTDDQGLRATNQGLSQARAEAVKDYLASHGVRRELLTASGQGADRPIESNDSSEGRARNRRIEFRLVP